MSATADRTSRALLVRPALEIDHLPHLHADGGRHLRGVHAAGRSVSDDQLSAHHHRRRQRRHADRADGGVDHAADRRGGPHRARPRGRALGHQPRLGGDQSVLQLDVDMLETLQLVDAAVSRVQSTLPPTAQIQTHRLDFSSFPDHRLQPDVGHGAADRSLGTGDLRHQAAAEPAARRRQRPHPGRPAAGIPRHRRSGADAARARRRSPTSSPPSTAPTSSIRQDCSTATISCSSASSTAQVHSAEDIGNIVVKHANSVPVRVRDIATVGAGDRAGLHGRSAPTASRRVLLSVNRQPDSNTVQVADEVHQEMAAIRPIAAGRRRDAAVLRSVRHRQRSRSPASATRSSSACSSPG